MNRPCSECGSRNWPRKGTECPLCREDELEEGDEPEDEDFPPSEC